MCLALSFYVLFISVIHSVHGAQFLYITSLFHLSASFAESSSPSAVIVTVPLTSMYGLA